MTWTQGSINVTDIHVTSMLHVLGRIAPAKKRWLGRVFNKPSILAWSFFFFQDTSHLTIFAATICGRIIHNLEIPLSIPYQKVALARHHGSKQNCKSWVLIVQSAFSGQVLKLCFFCRDCHPRRLLRLLVSK